VASSVSVEITGSEFTSCPFARYRELPPVFEAAGIGVAITGYQDLLELGRDAEVFSRQLDKVEGRRYVGIGKNPVGAEVEVLLAQAHPHVPALFTADPPTHTRHRKLVSQAFLPRRVRAMEPKVRAVANELVDAFVGDGEVDLVRQFAVPLPLTVLAEVLGVDAADRHLLKKWSDDLIRGLTDVLGDEERLAVARSLLDFQAYFRERIEERRAAPRNDLLGNLVAAELEDGSRLELSELFPIIAQLVAAGHETTSNFIANSMALLLQRPELQAELRADPERIPAFLEESLRFDPPLHATVRRAKREVELHGVRIEEDATVLPFWGAGNRDPDEFPEPERFDPDRPNARKHLAFGHGIHFCIGAELARREGRIALETLLSRLERIELDEERSDLEHRGGFAHYGYRRLVLRFAAR
jgi:cytochrome P450